MLVAWVGKNIEDWFNATDDDEARKKINASSCDEIAAMSDAQLRGMFDAMIDGPTGDDDENAMCKVLECLPCSRVTGIVNHYGVDDLADEFNGSEWDRLMVRLQQCGLVSYSDWDDDATRKFINQTPTDALAYLSIDTIVTLCHNLFSGSCGDDDEQAILRLMGSQSPAKIADIITNRISINEFDDNIDGDEWDQFIDILINAMQSA